MQIIPNEPPPNVSDHTINRQKNNNNAYSRVGEGVGELTEEEKAYCSAYNYIHRKGGVRKSWKVKKNIY